MGTQQTEGLSQDQLDALGTKGPAPQLLTRADILGVTDLKFEIVPVPEWGGNVRVRGLRAVERDEYEASMVKQRGKNVDVNIVNIRAGLVARTICDMQGNRVFSDGDIALLGQKSAAALERVFEVASRLSTIDESALETLVGNSASGRSGASSSA